MKKIISLFQRNYDGDRLVRPEVVAGAEWVFAGEGIATRKYDGSPVMVRDGKLYKRYDAKVGRTPPPDFEPTQDPDPQTGHWPGWIPVGEGPEDQWFRVAYDNARYESESNGPTKVLSDGTYEAVGPHFQGNPEEFLVDGLMRHGAVHLAAPRNYDLIRAYLAPGAIEGIVWHHPDGRMVKIKAKDFGIKRAKRRSA